MFSFVGDHTYEKSGLSAFSWNFKFSLFATQIQLFHYHILLSYEVPSYMFVRDRGYAQGDSDMMIPWKSQMVFDLSNKCLRSKITDVLSKFLKIAFFLSPYLSASYKELPLPKKLSIRAHSSGQKESN